MTYILHCGDCLEYMKSMPDGSVDLVLTDPPYPGLKGNIKYKNSGGVAPARIATETVGTPWDVSLEWVVEAWRVARLGMMVFCSHHSIALFKNELPEAETPALVVWYKRNSPPPVNNVPWQETEFIWLFKKQPGLKWRNLRTLYDVPMLQAGCFASERILNKDGSTAHPTQKPELLIRRLLSVGGESVLDPFMGTGTSGVSSVHLGLQYFGCEKDQKYYAIAEKRIAQAAAQPGLFTPTEAQPLAVTEAML